MSAGFQTVRQGTLGLQQHADLLLFIFENLYFILSVRGLRCCAGFSLVALIEGLSGVGVRAPHRGGLSRGACAPRQVGCSS